MISETVATRPAPIRAAGFQPSLPMGGLRSAVAGGNTVGGWIREPTARADGFRHIDSTAMITRLRAVGVNHYLFSVWDVATDWQDLCEEFAPAAQAAGIQIMIYLVPPTETQPDGRASRPFMLDFVRWAHEIARLSLRYPVITGWAIDDFDIGANPAVFTDAYLTEIRQAQLDINPDLGFFTCAYFETASTEGFMTRYGPFIDGIIYPYLDGPNCNTVRAGRIDADLDLIAAIADRHQVAVILLLYTGRFLDGVLAPTEDYVTACLDRALRAAAGGKVAGVICYGMQVDGSPTIATERRSMYGDGRGALASSRATVRAGEWAELSTAVAVEPDSPRYELSFWHSRVVQPDLMPQRGDYLLQVLVDGGPVWSADVHDAVFLHLWVQGHVLQGAFEVSSALRGKRQARLGFRLTAMRDLRLAPVDVGIDHLQSVGFSIPDPGFESADLWHSSDSAGAVLAVVDRFVPDRPERIATAVTNGYHAHRDTVAGVESRRETVSG